MKKVTKGLVVLGVASAIMIPSISSAAVNTGSVWNNFTTYKKQYSDHLSSDTANQIKQLEKNIDNLNTQITEESKATDQQLNLLDSRFREESNKIRKNIDNAKRAEDKIQYQDQLQLTQQKYESRKQQIIDQHLLEKTKLDDQIRLNQKEIQALDEQKRNIFSLLMQIESILSPFKSN